MTEQERPFATATSEWVLVSLTRLQFPVECCGCMQRADRWQHFNYHFTLGEGGVQIQAPVCSVCQSANRRRYARIFVATFLLVILGAPLFSCLLGIALDALGVSGNTVVILAIVVLSVLLASSVGVAHSIAHARSTPLKLANYRPGDATLRIRFRNTNYRRLFAAAMSGRTSSV